MTYYQITATIDGCPVDSVCGLHEDIDTLRDLMLYWHPYALVNVEAVS